MEAALNVQHHDVGQGPLDRDRLQQLEATIKAGIDTFVKVGLALAEIRDSRLYRLTHATFEAYCRERWDISRPRAYQLIGSAEVASTLMSTTVDTVPQERVVRPLIGLSPEKGREVWAEAQRLAGDNQVVAAKHVEAAKLRLLPSKTTTITTITSTKTPVVVTQKERPCPKVGPPCVGMQFARLAVGQLEQIEPDDTERAAAFTLVRDWIGSADGAIQQKDAAGDLITLLWSMLESRLPDGPERDSLSGLVHKQVNLLGGDGALAASQVLLPHDRLRRTVRAALIAYQNDSSASKDEGRVPGPSVRNMWAQDIERMLRLFRQGRLS